MTAARDRVKDLMEQYRRDQKQWKVPSASFRSHTPRLAPPRKMATDAMYDPDASAAAASTSTVKRSKSSWAASATPQRPGVRQGVDKFYDPKKPEEMRYMHTRRTTPCTPRMSPTTDSGSAGPGQYAPPTISCGMRKW